LTEKIAVVYTAIPFRARTWPEQGFPCVVILTGKNLFSLQGTPLLIAGILYSLQGFPCENYYTGRSMYSLQGMGLQCMIEYDQGLHSNLSPDTYILSKIADVGNPKTPAPLASAKIGDGDSPSPP
jgi:hypothetical protein